VIVPLDVTENVTLPLELFHAPGARAEVAKDEDGTVNSADIPSIQQNNIFPKILIIPFPGVEERRRHCCVSWS